MARTVAELLARVATPLLFALPAGAFAQDIIVTGRGLPPARGDVALSVTTIERDRLLATASGRLEDALRDVAGLAQFRRSDARSANPTSQGLNLRGLGGNAAGRVLVLLDGVPQDDPFAGYVSWPALLPERLESARITRGGGSGANGPGALTGTIELESLSAANADGLRASLHLGSFASADARAATTAHLGTGFVLLAGGVARSDGFRPVVAEQSGVADRAAPYVQWSASGRGVVALGRGELQAGFNVFGDRRERGTAFSRNRTDGADASLRYVDRRLTLLAYLQTRSFASQFAAVDAARTTATPTLDQFRTPATGIGLRGEWRPALDGVALRLGGEVRRVEGTTNELFLFTGGRFTRLRTAGGSNVTLGAFAEAEREAGALTLTGGARIDHWRIGRGMRRESALAGGPANAVDFPARSGWRPTARLGAALAADRAFTLRTAGYLGWRLPTLNELYRPFRVGIEQTNANALLQPERSKGVELGVDWQPAPDTRVSASSFVMRLDDPIANVTLQTSSSAIVRERRNIAGIVSRGAEVDASVRRGDLRVFASATAIDARVAGSALRPAQVAQVTAAMGVAWRAFGITARYTGPQFEDDANLRRLAGAFTLDAAAGLRIGERTRLSLRVENIADARVAAAVSAAGVVERARPRAFWLGVVLD